MGEKNAGKSGIFPCDIDVDPNTAVGTLYVSSVSRVRGISRIDLIPAETTITGVRESSSRSVDMSSVFSPPRCTPPVPPVTNVEIPAKCASLIVDATVVAPH